MADNRGHVPQCNVATEEDRTITLIIVRHHVVSMSSHEYTGKLKAIPTRYDSMLYRSRLEARWAVVFTELEIPFIYEPEGFDLGDGIFYLPDFYLGAGYDSWVEVKPRELNKLEREKVKRLVSQSGKEVILLIGPPALTPFKYCHISHFPPALPQYIEDRVGCFWTYKALRDKRTWCDCGYGEDPDGVIDCTSRLPKDAPDCFHRRGCIEEGDQVHRAIQKANDYRTFERRPH